MLYNVYNSRYIVETFTEIIVVLYRNYYSPGGIVVFMLKCVIRQISTVFSYKLKGDIFMGLFNGLMGNASEYSVEKVQQELAPLLVDQEQVEKAFKVFRDGFVFTNKRLIMIDKQGVTGTKTEYLSIPYKSITRYARESAGIMDLDAELKIWVTGAHEPIIKKLSSDANINEVYSILSQHVLG